MSKKVGLSAVAMSNIQHYQQYGQSLLDKQQEKLTTQLTVFQQALATFAKNHSSEIKNNENFRKQFTELCFSVGVDPLAASLTKTNKSSSLWSSLLNDNNEEFYNELAVKIIELCKQFKDVNGGMISVDDLLGHMTDPSSPNAISGLTGKDIENGVSRLSILDPNFKIVSVGHKKYIRSVSKDLSTYEKSVFEICDVLGYTTVRILGDNFNWSEVHAKEVLDELVGVGFLWVDTQDSETHYWDPSWITKMD